MAAGLGFSSQHGHCAIFYPQTTRVVRNVERGGDRCWKTAKRDRSGHVRACTDGASVMRGAWEIIIKKYPHIVCCWCGAHVINLLMEDIGKLEFFASATIEAKQVVKSYATTSTQTSISTT